MEKILRRFFIFLWYYGPTEFACVCWFFMIAVDLKWFVKWCWKNNLELDLVRKQEVKDWKGKKTLLFFILTSHCSWKHNEEWRFWCIASLAGCLGKVWCFRSLAAGKTPLQFLLPLRQALTCNGTTATIIASQGSNPSWDASTSLAQKGRCEEVKFLFWWERFLNEFLGQDALDLNKECVMCLAKSLLKCFDPCSQAWALVPCIDLHSVRTMPWSRHSSSWHVDPVSSKLSWHFVLRKVYVHLTVAQHKVFFSCWNFANIHKSNLIRLWKPAMENKCVESQNATSFKGNNNQKKWTWVKLKHVVLDEDETSKKLVASWETLQQNHHSKFHKANVTHSKNDGWSIIPTCIYTSLLQWEMINWFWSKISLTLSSDEPMGWRLSGLILRNMLAKICLFVWKTIKECSWSAPSLRIQPGAKKQTLLGHKKNEAVGSSGIDHGVCFNVINQDEASYQNKA